MAAAAYVARTLAVFVGRLYQYRKRSGARRDAPTISDCAGFLQRLVSAVLVDRLQAARRDANTHKLLQLRHPNTLAPQIWQEIARHHFRDVPPDAAFFLGQAPPVNHAASHRSGSCDVTNFHVAKKAA